jgi:hypothetical protein
VIDPLHVPDVSPDERVTRYIVSSSHIRRSEGTVRPDAFMPHPRIELSVNRLRDASEEETWACGFDVARQRVKPLIGRADVDVANVATQTLTVVAKPLPNNANHADVVGWPSEKSEQKRIAVLIASLSQFNDAPAFQ